MPKTRPRPSRIARVVARRLLRRLDRRTPEWLQWLTPWGTSLAIHALVLFVLGVVIYMQSRASAPEPPGMEARFASQLADDLTSLKPSDHPGDPFASLASSEAPSLYLDPDRADPLATNVPEPPPSIRLGAEFRVTSPGPASARGGGRAGAKAAGAPSPAGKGGAAGDGGDGEGEGASAPMKTVPFSGRMGEKKARLLRREGGTVESEKAVERGLDWIARHQRRDGSWGLDTRAQCPKSPGCPQVPAGTSDVGATGLALLPLLGAGHTHTNKGRYQATISKGLHWLLKHQKPSGELFTGGGEHTGMYSHAIATMAICEAYGMTGDEPLHEPARKAVRYIVSSQNKLDGGWRYYPGQEGDTSVFGWELFALRSARMAGIGIPRTTISLCRQYLDAAATDPSKSLYGYRPGTPVTPSMTAEGLLGRQILGWPRDHPALAQGVSAVAANLDGYELRNTYYWYYATQLLHNMRGPEWPRWNERVREGLIGLQVLSDGCDRGSWDPTSPQPDFWLMRGGRLAITSLSLLTLEVYYRYLPMYREPGDELDEPPVLDAKAPAR